MCLVLGSQTQAACTTAAAGVSPWHMLHTDKMPRLLSRGASSSSYCGQCQSQRLRTGRALVPEGKSCSAGAGSQSGRRPRVVNSQALSAAAVVTQGLDLRASPVGTEPQPSPADLRWLVDVSNKV